jgi:hypothetical protein
VLVQYLFSAHLSCSHLLLDRDLADLGSTVPDALVDAVKQQMEKNQNVQPGEVDEGVFV